MNWKTLCKAILVMVGLSALITLTLLIIHIFPFWVSLVIAFIAGVVGVYHMMEKEDDYSDEEEEDETQQTV